MSIKKRTDQEKGIESGRLRHFDGRENAVSELVPRDDIPEDADDLFGYLVELVEHARSVASVQANATLTMRNWLIGRAINVNVLCQKRADYGKQIVASLTQQMTARFGSGFDRTNVSRMMRFADLYPTQENVESLAQQVSWTHIRELLVLESSEARAFYVEQTVTKRLGVRDLRKAVARKAYERRDRQRSDSRGLDHPA